MIRRNNLEISTTKTRLADTRNVVVLCSGRGLCDLEFLWPITKTMNMEDLKSGKYKSDQLNQIRQP
jgi:hypothetical protein